MRVVMRGAGADDAGIGSHHIFQLVHFLGRNRLIYMDHHIYYGNIHHFTPSRRQPDWIQKGWSIIHSSKHAAFL
jgi:hypothetical protein